MAFTEWAKGFGKERIFTLSSGLKVRWHRRRHGLNEVRDGESAKSPP